MPKMKITTVGVERLNPPATGQVDYFDTILSGFGLRVTYGGAKTYFAMVRVNGKLMRVTVGRANAMTLDVARDKARDAMELAGIGKDPREVWKEREATEALSAAAQAEVDAKLLFPAVAKDFLAKYPKRKNLRPSTLDAYRRTLQGDDVAGWANKSVADITKGDVRAVIDKRIERGMTAGADRWLAYASVFFGWCAERDLIQNVPTDRIGKQFSIVKGERYLTLDELKEVWRAAEGLGWPFGPFVKVLLLTGQRRDEIGKMMWSEVVAIEDTEGAVLDLPGTRTKNKLPHLVPLCGLAREAIAAAPRINKSAFVFTTTARAAISGYSKAKARMDKAIAEARLKDDRPPMPDWDFHDLRRTFATHAHETLKAPPHVVEAVLNHVTGGAKNGVAGVYNRAQYLDDRRALLGAWADLVKNLVSEPTK